MPENISGIQFTIAKVQRIGAVYETNKTKTNQKSNHRIFCGE
jgi:hypothetical protein